MVKCNYPLYEGYCPEGKNICCRHCDRYKDCQSDAEMRGTTACLAEQIHTDNNNNTLCANEIII